jgi:hypothetical protein
MFFVNFTIISTFALSLGEIYSRGLLSPILLKKNDHDREHNRTGGALYSGE